MRRVEHLDDARKHRAKMLQSVAITVGVGKTVADRAALDRIDRARHHLIYIPDPTVGARGVYHHIVTALGGKPSFHTAALIPQARNALAAEASERGRTRSYSSTYAEPATMPTSMDFECELLSSGGDSDRTGGPLCRHSCGLGWVLVGS
jgi:hypothetical protein